MRPVCQVRKAVSNVNASCKVCHFCVLEQLQAVHTESSTRNAGGNLFGTVSSVSCAKGPSGSSNHMHMLPVQHFNACRSTQTKAFAICVFCTSRKWKKEVRAQAAQAFQTQPTEHTRYERCHESSSFCTQGGVALPTGHISKRSGLRML